MSHQLFPSQEGKFISLEALIEDIANCSRASGGT
jgi:hypothetical protein